ncbi:5-hydroxytryptamine receptor 2C-like [Dreissena polymorpha]|nr:5-hydroxytryptamine receptor 2C-like [Dreissena polymorpha]
MVCMAISLEKRLQTVTNYFLLSLAVTDLLVCLLVMPLSIIDELFGYWRFTTVMCNVFVTVDVMMCTSSILHLCGISVQRYIAIQFPLRARNKSKSIVIAKIGCIWLLAILISSPVTVLGALDEFNILNEHHCTLKHNGFIIYGSILAFFIPLVIMIITYALTVRLLYKQSKRCDYRRSSESAGGAPIIRRCRTSSVRRSEQPRTREEHNPDQYELIEREKLNNNSNLQNGYTRVPSILSHSVSCETISGRGAEHSAYERQNIKVHNSCFLAVPGGFGIESSLDSFSGSDLSDDDDHGPRRGSFTLGGDSSRRHSFRDIINKQFLIKASSILNLARDRNKDRTAVRTEQKASKVLGLVFALFLLCWLPFFIVNVIPAMCARCNVPATLVSTCSWLGWASSTINPIIYTMFNKTFKRCFAKFLTCDYGRQDRPVLVTPSYSRKMNISIRDVYSD